MQRHRAAIVSWLVLALVAGSLVVYAVRSEGYPVHRADLNDGGIWVTNQSAGAIGRQNKPVAQLDGLVFDGDPWRPSTVDVLQSGSAVVSVDRAAGTLMPIDVMGAAPLEDQKVVVDGSPEIGGGVVAAVNPENGKVWAAPIDTSTGVTSLAELGADAEPVARVGGGASLVVSAAGTILAVSSQEGTLTTIRSSSTGFSEPSITPLDPQPAGDIVQMTAVGDSLVAIDEAGSVITAGGVGTEPLPAGAQLQQPGPAADDVLVATDGALHSVSLEDGSAVSIAEGVGAPARPVRLGGCVYAAWSAGRDGTVATACHGEDADVAGFEVSPDAEMVFRVNRTQLLLNDIANGDVWDLDGGKPRQIADWASLRPETTKADDEPQEQDPEQSDVTQPPTAVADDLGVRAGRSTVLHVLDNDKASKSAILSIVDVSMQDRPGVEVQVAPNQQSILVDVAPGESGSVGFTYTIDDGTNAKSAQDDGDVSLTIRGDGGTAVPRLRENYEPTVLTVAAGATLQVPVLPDWRDPQYGDPVVLQSADVPQGDVDVTPEGTLRFVAPTKGGVQRISYAVSTGSNELAREKLAVNVLSPDSLRPVAPQAKPDVAAGEVGASIKIRPLDNDIPGADPSDPGAQLEIAGDVAPKGGLEVSTDLESGIVTVVPTRPGVVLLDYRAGFGSAERAAARIRVDVTAPSKESNAPIAAPDSTAVRGTSPMTVDVLANDFDARGRMLVVQHAQPVESDGSLEVAVVDGRWIRVSAQEPDITPRSQTIRYTISNGDTTAEGTLTVTQRPPLTGVENAPVVESDEVSVRVGDSVSVPVLDNDSTPSGDPVGLLQDPAVEPAGELKVLPSVGKAYVSGRHVRYVAPAEVDGPTDVQVQYVVENQGDPTASTSVGTIDVHVIPEPSKRSPNQAPTPRAIEGRVVQGDVVTLKLAPVGSDPDGDSVSIVGLETPPKHGRVLSYGANALVYQAFPEAQGTDEFTYVVSDRYGETATGEVRVGVVPPGAPQAPVAVNDTFFADVDREMTVDVLANDLRTPGTELTILPLETTVAGVSLEAPGGPVTLRSAGVDGGAVRIPYRVTNGLQESTGVLTVKSREGFNNAPVAADAFAQPEADSASVTVEVLSEVYDIDGAEADLTLESVSSPRATIEDGSVTVPVLDVAQTLSYRVTDAEGAAASAAIHIPARPKDAPYLKPGAEIALEPGQVLEVDIADLVVDPEGDEVFLTTEDEIWAAPDGLLEARSVDQGTLRLEAADDTGPAAVTFVVTDRAKLADLTASPAVLTVPVQVGESAPVINCPSQQIEVPEGGSSRVLDIAAICHVWTADPADADSLTFDAEWDDEIPGVTVESSEAGLVLTAGNEAPRGAVGSLVVSADGTEAAGRLLVKVTAVGPPTISPISLDTRAGEAVSVDVAQYVSSPLPDPELAVEVEPVGGADAATQVDGSTVTFTPAERTDGVMRFLVRVSDTGSTRGNRPDAVGEVQLAVVDVPDAPTGLRTGDEVLAGTVALSWNTPDANGERIDRYEVSYDGGTYVCAGSPCRVPSLENGTEYSFRVRAHNAVGWSDPSGAVRARPDALPGRPLNLTIDRQRDRRVQISWDPPAPYEGSRVRAYQVTYPGGGIQRTSGRTFTASVPENGVVTTFTISAVNDMGEGPAASVRGMGAGRPAAPGAPAIQPSTSADRTSKSVRIAWAAVGANGPGPVSYLVRRTGGGAGTKIVCEWVERTSCSDDVVNDGSVYTYSVQAQNAEEAKDPGSHRSSFSAGSQLEAAATPDQVVIREFVATGRDGEARVTFDVGDSHGKVNRVRCTVNGGSCGEWTFARTGESGVQRTVNGLPDGQSSSVQLWACNDSTNVAQSGSACSDPATASTTTYGAIGEVSLDVTAAETRLNWSYTVDPNGKPVHVKLTRNGSVVTEYDTGVGVDTRSGSEDVGYSHTGNYVLTVTDTASAPGQSSPRAGKSDTASARTADPPKSVSISKGSRCDSACPAGGAGYVPCTNGPCYFIVTTTKNFPGTVSCYVENKEDGRFGTGYTMGGNASREGPSWYGSGLSDLRAVCDGVPSPWVTW